MFDDSVVVQFESVEQMASVRACVAGRVSGARLPPQEWCEINADVPPDLIVSVRDLDDAWVEIEYGGLVEVPRYRVDRAGLHWDFSKIVTAVLLPRLIEGGTVPLHAAVIGARGGVLLPGSSGAGKSSVSFAALDANLAVYASELAFVQRGQLVAANSTLTIDPVAAALLGGEPAAPTLVDSRLTQPLAPLPENGVAIVGLAFPKVCDAPLRVRDITPRRARMLLFENIVSQLPVSQLVAHESEPLSLLPTRSQLRTIADECQRLSELKPTIVEGRPDDVLGHIVTMFELAAP